MDNHIETVMHLKKKLEKGVSFEKTMHILYKLQKIPISIKLLETTGIGFKVRELSKAEKSNDIGKTAKLLTMSWKDFVRHHQNSRSTPGNHHHSDGDQQSDTSPRKQAAHDSEESVSPSRHRHRSSKKHHHHHHHHHHTNNKETTNGHSQPQPTEDIMTPDDSSSNETNPTATNTNTTISRHKSKKHKKNKKHKKSSKEVEADSDGGGGGEERKERKKRHREEDKAAKSNSANCDSNNTVKRIRIKEPVDPNAPKSSSSSSSKANQRVITVKDEEDDLFGQMLNGIGNDSHYSKSATSTSRPSKFMTPAVPSTSSAHHHHRSSSSANAKLNSSAPPPSTTNHVDLLNSLPDPNYRPTTAHHRMDDLLNTTYSYDGLPNRKVEPVSAKPNMAGLKLFKGRTAVWAGSSKLVTVPKVYGLQELCIRLLMNHIDMIYEVGDLPYYILKPVLVKCSVAQLSRIESFNPQLLEETDELWKEFCEKEFKSKANFKTKYPTWRAFYNHLVRDRDERLKRITEGISSKARKAVPERKTQTIDLKMPREIRRRQERSTNPFFSNNSSSGGGGSGRSGLVTLGGTAPGVGGMVQLANKPKTAPLMKKLLQMRKSKGFGTGNGRR